MKLLVLILIIFAVSANSAGFKGFLPTRSKSIFVSTYQDNWYMALKNCKENGMQLVTVTDADKNQEVTAILEDLSDTKLWLAGTDLGSEGLFYWATTNEPFDFTAWHEGQPDNMNENHHCVVIYANPNSNITAWSDDPCWIPNNSTYYDHKFLCETIPLK